MGRDKEKSLQQQVREMKRVIGGVGQDIENMAKYFDGKDGEFGAMLYRQSVTLSALIELLGVDDAKLTEIVNRRDAENEARAKERHEAMKAANAAAQEAKATQAEANAAPAEVVN